MTSIIPRGAKSGLPPDAKVSINLDSPKEIVARIRLLASRPTRDVLGAELVRHVCRRPGCTLQATRLRRESGRTRATRAGLCSAHFREFEANGNKMPAAWKTPGQRALEAAALAVAIAAAILGIAALVSA